MTTSIPVPAGGPVAPKTNHLGLVKKEYDGVASTLCKGCGHDAITAALIQALW